MERIFDHVFERVASFENLLFAWREFRRGKMKKRDVQEFAMSLEENIFELHQDVITQTYEHQPYESFFVYDPKLRHIHKASVRDRVLHQAVFRVLYPIFDKKFIFDSYSSRIDKGTHRAVSALHYFARRASDTFHSPAYVLQCDIKKFFDSIDHTILSSLIRKTVSDERMMRLLQKIIDSFSTVPGRGIPLGNVTSQLFGNIYLNELDQFVTRTLNRRFYVRYSDDFLIVANDRKLLQGIIPVIDSFLQKTLLIRLHEHKIKLRTYVQGVDFLGYVSFPLFRILRIKTKHRILKRATRELLSEQTTQSYLGILGHCRGHKIEKELLRLQKQI